MFEICLGAILTQNTSWDNVVKVMSGLKDKDLLSFSRLEKIPPIKLQKLIRSSGYFRQKSKRISDFLEIIRKSRRGKFSLLLSGKTQDVREFLLSINGIGPETADSMLLYAGGHPLFVVDAYTRRIGVRWGVIKGSESYDQIQDIFMKALPSSAGIYGEYHALLVELAKKNCRKKPVCQGCPVQKLCPAGKKETG